MWIPRTPKAPFSPAVQRKLFSLPGSASIVQKDVVDHRWLHTLEAWYQGVQQQGWKCQLNTPPRSPTSPHHGMELFEKHRDTEEEWDEGERDAVQLLNLLANHNSLRFSVRCWRQRASRRRLLEVRTTLVTAENHRRALGRPWSRWRSIALQRRSLLHVRRRLLSRTLPRWKDAIKREVGKVRRWKNKTFG